jgi:hypothetical protein
LEGDGAVTINLFLDRRFGRWLGNNVNIPAKPFLQPPFQAV